MGAEGKYMVARPNGQVLMDKGKLENGWQQSAKKRESPGGKQGGSCALGGEGIIYYSVKAGSHTRGLKPQMIWLASKRGGNPQSEWGSGFVTRPERIYSGTKVMLWDTTASGKSGATS